MDLSVVDLTPYLAIYGELGGSDQLGPELSELCTEVSRSLKETGALLVKDPRCSVEDNDRFIDMMERYFQSSEEFKRRQERPHLHYQVRMEPWINIMSVWLLRKGEFLFIYLL